MKILCPEYMFWETGEIVSGYVLLLNKSGKIKKLLPYDRLTEKQILKIEYLKGLLIPGLVNAHCHLELSWLKGLISNVEGMEDFFSKMRGVHKKRKNEIHALDAVDQSITEMYQNGINVCADICNTRLSFLAKENSNMYFHSFVEVFEKEGNEVNSLFDKAKELISELVENKINTASLSLHTLFTSSIELFKIITTEIIKQQQIHSIHFLESKEESLFLTEGKPIKNIHENLNIKHEASSPAEIAKTVLPKENRVLFVHNTYASEDDIMGVLETFSEPWFCFCPESNLNISGKLPDIPMIKKLTQNLVIGTDSYASNLQLNMFNEMQDIYKAFPEISFEELLTMASLNGAKFLGIDKEYGSISPGKTPGLIQIRDYSPDCQNLLFTDIRRIF